MLLAFQIIFAFLYDLLLLLAVWFVAAIPFVVWQGDNLHTSPASMVAFQVYLLAITYLYLTFFWTARGQTPGFKSWGIRLQRQDGYLLTRHNANVRFLLVILLFAIGWIYLFIPQKNKPYLLTLQDKFAGTAIVKVEKQ